MSKILVLGSAPLPFMNTKRLYGPGIRTWQFALPLLHAGHEVKIIAGQVPGSMPHGEPHSGPSSIQEMPGLSLTLLEQAEFERIQPVLGSIGPFLPDAIVAAGYGASMVAVKLGMDLPIWADFFGDPMAEAQAMAWVHGDDRPVHLVWSYIAPVLDRADKFSAVSERQKFAVIGQLASRGRLNRRTMGYELVCSAPCGIVPETLPCVPSQLRGSSLPKQAFLVMWSGGYNTWADADSLFSALEFSMRENPHIHFISTGGQIDGHDESTYPRFAAQVAASQFKDRFHLLGWVETREVRGLYQECDLGINVDKPCYEGILGSRNRILDWMDAGLPVLTTETCELSSLLREHELGFVIPPGNPETLAREILSLSREKDLLAARASKAKTFAGERFSFEATTREVQSWALTPVAAPDRNMFPRLGNPWSWETTQARRKLAGLRIVARDKGIVGVTRVFVDGILRRLRGRANRR